MKDKGLCGRGEHKGDASQGGEERESIKERLVGEMGKEWVGM